MSPVRIAYFGAGHLGRQIHHHVRHHCPGVAEPIGFLDDTRPAGEPVIDGLKTLGSLAAAATRPGLQPAALQIVFAIGYADMHARRAALDRVLQAGYTLHTVLHPRAVIEPGVQVGAGSIVLANAVLDQQVSIGAACFIDIGVRLTAGTTVGSNNYFASGTSTGSRVVIGDNCFFGMDCTITTDVVLGSNLFVNAKTLVARSAGDDLKIVELHKTRELPTTRR